MLEWHSYWSLCERCHYDVAVLQTDICEVCPSPLVLSQQLTHIELERLSMIGPEEFIQAFAVEKKLGVSWCLQCNKKNNLVCEMNCCHCWVFCVVGLCCWLPDTEHSLSYWRALVLWPPYVIGQAIIFLPCGFYLPIYLLSLPNLSGRRLDVCHTSTHGVALVRI